MDLDLSNKYLTQLPNLPDKTERFNCSDNKLSNLIGSPKEINGNFICTLNRLTSLIGSPNHVAGKFDCSYNKLTTLNGSPKKVESFICGYNKLTDLTGSPKYVDGSFRSNNNILTSLFSMSKIIKSYFTFEFNPNLLDISDIWNSDIRGSIFFDLNPGMAILPLIKFKVKCYLPVFAEIHERNQGSSKQNIIDFQYDLMEHGYEDYAKWKPEVG